MGVCFDFYRILRWRIGLNRFLTFLGDLLFSLLALFIIFAFAQKANYLELRFYLFGGSLLGLLLYLKFVSKITKTIINGIISFIVGTRNFILGMIAAFCRSSIDFLTLLMSIPYGLLRWLSILLYRIGEAFGKESITKIKNRIPKTPRE